MEITVRLYGQLCQFMNGLSEVRLEVKDGLTIRGLLAQLGIPHSAVFQAIVSGRFASLDDTVKKGETVSLVPPMEGG